MSRIAERGVRLSQFHTTALCSPTRASLLTGRNATTVGMATIEEFTDGFPELQRPHSCRHRTAVRGAQRAGIQHLLRRQVASDTAGRGESRCHAAPLAAVSRVREVLRLHGRRDRPVVSRPGLRQPSGQSACHPRGRLPPVEGHRRQDDRVHSRRQGDRTGQAVVQLCLPGRRARAAPRVQGMGGQVRRQVRHGLRALSRDRAGEPEEARHRAAGHRIVASQPVSRCQGSQR